MKHLWIILMCALVVSCDDGDIITQELDFTNTSIQACLPQETSGNREYLFYQIENTNFESLSIALTTSDEIFQEGTYGPYDITSNPIEYRSYNGIIGNDYFCSNIPPASPTVTRLYQGTAGTISLNTFFLLDDNDGIAAADEGIDLTNLANSQDTDGDGIPDYYDSDDDGDNIPTAQEDRNGNNDLTDDDTDNDNIPNYLDNDDDGDGVLTINETTDGNIDPADDITGGVPHYLNPTISLQANPLTNSYIEHNYTQTPSIQIDLNNFILTRGSSSIIFDGNVYEYGTYIGTGTPVTTIPNF